MLGYEVNDEFVLLCGSLTVRWKGILGNMYAASSFFCQNKYSFIFIFLLNINTLLLYHLVEWEIPKIYSPKKKIPKIWAWPKRKGPTKHCQSAMLCGCFFLYFQNYFLFNINISNKKKYKNKIFLYFLIVSHFPSWF